MSIYIYVSVYVCIYMYMYMYMIYLYYYVVYVLLHFPSFLVFLSFFVSWIDIDEDLENSPSLINQDMEAPSHEMLIHNVPVIDLSSPQRVTPTKKKTKSTPSKLLHTYTHIYIYIHTF